MAPRAAAAICIRVITLVKQINSPVIQQKTLCIIHFRVTTTIFWGQIFIAIIVKCKYISLEHVYVSCNAPAILPEIASWILIPVLPHLQGCRTQEIIFPYLNKNDRIQIKKKNIQHEKKNTSVSKKIQLNLQISQKKARWTTPFLPPNPQFHLMTLQFIPILILSLILGRFLFSHYHCYYFESWLEPRQHCLILPCFRLLMFQATG